jgi:DNA-directed RNA polymerase
MFTSSCLSQLLPDEIFYTNGEEGNLAKDSSTLDRELGIDSVWESHLEEEDYLDFNGIVEEQQVSSSMTTRIDPPEQRRTMKKKSAMEMLRNFDPQDPPSSDDEEELQLWLECAAQREAVIRYQNLVEKARDRKGFDSMSLMHQGLRDDIETRQKEYISNQDTRRAKKRYGPFLCSLHPDKLAVILSHEAITQSLLFSGKNGRDGVPLIKMATAIGAAVETEVVSQRRIKERYHDTTSSPSRTSHERPPEPLRPDYCQEWSAHCLQDFKRNPVIIN